MVGNRCQFLQIHHNLWSCRHLRQQRFAHQNNMLQLRSGQRITHCSQVHAGSSSIGFQKIPPDGRINSFQTPSVTGKAPESAETSCDKTSRQSGGNPLPVLCSGSSSRNNVGKIDFPMHYLRYPL